MSKIFLFTPIEHHDSKENLFSFIKMCRENLMVFGRDLDWEANNWPGIANFTKIGVHSRRYSYLDILDTEILEFSKAYLTYQQTHNPTKLKNELKALRCIEKSLLYVCGRADITLVCPQVLDVAAEVAREYKATAYQAGIQLVKLVEFLNDSQIINKKIVWRSPFSKPKELSRTDAEGKHRRNTKIPSAHSLENMAEMFANDLQSPKDRYTTSLFALLMSAPSRVTEAQLLSTKCIHYEKDRNGVQRVGLRWWAAKGFGACIKWIPSIFEDVVQEAIRRLEALSRPGRELALYYESNPGRFYRHDNCPDVDDYSPLTFSQVEQALGLKPNGGNTAKVCLKKYGPFNSLVKSKQPMTLDFLHQYCISQLPSNWPWLNQETGLKYSDGLFCLRAHELRLDLSTSPVLLWTPDNNTFTNDLKNVSGRNKLSIWQRHGYKNPDGSQIDLTSHQIRHFINTAAQRGDLGELDIAKWSGRANVRQNSVYNHMADEEYVDAVRELNPEAHIINKITQNTPVTLNDLNAIGDGIAHVTEFGYCVHDYSMVPCQRHRDCLNCTEQVCVKGDVIKLERLKLHRELISTQLEKAKLASGNGVYGAGRWSQHQVKTLERADALINILESQSTPDGTVIWLSHDQEYSPLKKAVDAHSPEVQDLPDLNELRLILGGKHGKASYGK